MYTRTLYKVIVVVILMIIATWMSLRAQAPAAEPVNIILSGPTRVDVGILLPLVDYEHVVSSTDTVTRTVQLTVDGSELIFIQATSTHDGVRCTPRAKLLECLITLPPGDSATIHFVAARTISEVYARITHCIVVTGQCIETLIVGSPYRSLMPVIIKT